MRRTNTPTKMNACIVCGSSAPITKASSTRTMHLCYYHEYVCNDHLSDPCAVCDTK